MNRKVTKIGLAVCGVLLVASFGEIAAWSGEPQQGKPAASAQATVLSDLVKDWQAQKKEMMDIADAMPEDKFGYKATPAERNFGEQVMHIATVNVGILKFMGGKATPPAFNAKSKADMLKALADSYDYGTALLSEQNETTITQTIEAPKFLGPSTRARIVWFLMGHSMDIYGQMVVYLRMNGIVPPASRRGGV